MRIGTLTDTIGLGDLVCDECGGGVDATSETAPVRLLNVVSLSRRQFRQLIELEPPAAEQPFKAGRFRLAPFGVAAIDTLELVAGAK